jgi:osmotically-inducible protein OsmY
MSHRFFGGLPAAGRPAVVGYPLPETVEEAERLAASVERAVFRETCGGVRNLRVEVSDQGILLTGRCTSYYTKQKAQHAAMGVSGTEELTNGIEVV